MTITVHLDLVVGNVLRGWALDDEKPEDPLTVEIIAGNRQLGSVVADHERRDLTTDDTPVPRAGFRFVLPPWLLTGEDCEFTARAMGNSIEPVTVTRRLATTRLAYAKPTEKPWVETLANVPQSFGFDEDKLRPALACFRDGDTDGGIGIARSAFRANPDLFAVDTGIVDAVTKHTEVKSFEQLMADRRHDWFELENHSLWQSQLEKKKAMHAFARRSLVKIPRQIAHFTDPLELLSLDLPDRFVAKPDGLASAKGVFAVSRGLNVFTGKRITRERIVDTWRRLAEETNRIEDYIVEEFVADRFAPNSDIIPLDFKVYVFGGTAGFMEVFDRNYPEPTRTPYSVTWRPLPHPLEIRRSLGPVIRRPDNLEDLVTVAERLGKEMGAFCRVDLFNTADGPVLGEITTLPANGKNRTWYANRIIQQAYIVFEDRRLWAVDA